MKLPEFTDEQKAELSATVAAWNATEARILTASNRALKRLSDKSLNAEPSMFLANICVELDAKFGVGTTLCLDWMLDNYVALEFERRVYPWFIDIWQELKAGGYTVRNQFDYDDYEAFYIPHETKRLVVMGSWWKYGGSKVIVIEEPGYEGFMHQFSVRRIWKRIRRDCIGGVDHPTLACYRERDFAMKYIENPRWYGDCRDPGYIMGYDKLSPAHAGKCEKVIWDLKAPIRWFFDVNILWTALCFPEHDSGLTNPEDILKRKAA